MGAVGNPLLSWAFARINQKTKLIEEQTRRLIANEGELPIDQLKLNQNTDLIQNHTTENALKGNEDYLSDFIYHQANKKLTNISHVISYAALKLNDLEDSSIDDEVSDDEWISRFFDHTQYVSSSDMQKIWGAILSRKIEKTESSSIRTLDVLRNISKEDAGSFNKIFYYQFFGFFPVTNSNEFEKLDLKWDDFFQCKDAGLVDCISGRSQNLNFDNSELIWYTPKIAYKLKLMHENDANTIQLPSPWKLTRAGREISFALEWKTPNQQYFQALAQTFKQHQVNLEVSYPGPGSTNEKFFPLGFSAVEI